MGISVQQAQVMYIEVYVYIYKGISVQHAEVVVFPDLYLRTKATRMAVV
jgi:hypothetical protein